MRDKIITAIEKHGVWFFCLWCLFIVVAISLTSCGDKERSEKYEDDWSKAKPLVMERYIDASGYYERKISTFIMDDHKIIIYQNGYGGRMVAIPLNSKCVEDEEYKVEQ
jgi:hypothetical protein